MVLTAVIAVVQPFDFDYCFKMFYIGVLNVQYIRDMNTRLVWYSNGHFIIMEPSKWAKQGWVANGPDFEWDLKYGSPTIWNPYKWPPFCQRQNQLKSGQKCSDFEWSGFWMVGCIAIVWRSWPENINRKVYPRFLDFSAIWASRIKIPTCIFPPAFGCCALQTLEKLIFSCFFHVFAIFWSKKEEN